MLGHSSRITGVAQVDKDLVVVLRLAQPQPEKAKLDRLPRVIAGLIQRIAGKQRAISQVGLHWAIELVILTRPHLPAN